MDYVYSFHSTASEDVEHKLCTSLDQPMIFSKSECKIIESFIEDVIKSTPVLKPHTVDRALLRNKYFFGERYTYGSQMSQKGTGMERLYPKNSVDPIPSWMYYYVINPLVEAKIIEENFVNSAVINEYQPGGCIVSHIDPPHIFDRPIVSISLYSDSTLCFGCKFEFKPIRCSKPIFKLSLPRGVVTLMNGFSADDITHCVRPEDTKEYRAVIILRRVLPNAPRLQSLEHANAHLVKTSLNITELDGEIFKKFYKKYSKSYKEKRNVRHGGICKANGNKVFFADNKRYANKPYNLFEN